MKSSFSVCWKKTRYVFYLISIFILLFLTGTVLIQSISDFSGMTYLSSIVPDTSLSLIMICGAVTFAAVFLLIGKLLTRLSERRQIILTVILAPACIALQFWFLFSLRAVLRYDHLKVFDGALEIIRTGQLSLSANNHYFGNYPFNIPITVFHSLLLRIIQFFNIPEADYMLMLQCFYLFFIDLGILFSWNIVRLLHSVRNATLLALLCFFNPLFYVCATGCYTSTLMMPLLMGVLLLIILLLKEKSFYKKLLYSGLLGLFLVFAANLRVTVLIAAIALVIYLIIREPTEKNPKFFKRQTLILCCCLLLCAVISSGVWEHAKARCITEDYTDTQMPPLYYLMFAANPDFRGTYNESDYQLISSYDTLEQKNEASWKILKQRLGSMGFSGLRSLSAYKLKHTWSDGIEDYQDFINTSRNYSQFHSRLGHEQGDFFALYCHIYHLATIALLFIAICFAVAGRCSSPYYLIFLTLLGGMIFHIFWESGYVYSFGFCMLLSIPASEGASRLSQFKKGWIPAGIVGFLSVTAGLLLLNSQKEAVWGTEYTRTSNAVVQDMFTDDGLPLLEGDTITQTFMTDRPFELIGCKIFNSTGSENTSLYRIELFSETGELLASQDYPAEYIPNKDHCYLKVPQQIPEGRCQYTIVIQALKTSEEHYLTFAYYHTQNYDIYADGRMTGLDSDEKTDLTFFAVQNITDIF